MTLYYSPLPARLYHPAMADEITAAAFALFGNGYLGASRTGMIPYLKCMLVVAATVGLPPRVLPVIQKIEGGSAGIVRQDSNGTEDFGVMQVNSIWIGPLAARAEISEADTRQRLIDDPCFNIAAAGLILQSYLAETHGALLPAIGDYHSHTPALNEAYATQAEQQAIRLFTQPSP
jgi:hypothetical protein